jgi:hypothetical protein
MEFCIPIAEIEVTAMLARVLSRSYGSGRTENDLQRANIG